MDVRYLCDLFMNILLFTDNFTATEALSHACVSESWLKCRADGGVGMIIMENTRVDDAHGVAAVQQASVARDEHIEPLRKVVEMLHGKDVVVFTQLHHPGRETFSNLNSDEPVWSSSSKACGVCGQETHEMTTEEVELVISKFAEGARRPVCL